LSQIALIGHSRAGKTALWAGAPDERFALVIANNSGSTGAALARGKVDLPAETVQHINTYFPHWFCANYKAFNNHEQALPLDQHMLLALIAPRLLYVASAADDAWACPPAEYASLLHAQSAWKLHQHEILLNAEFPVVNSSFHNTRTGYHLRPGRHGLTLSDWNNFLAFADIHLRTQPAKL